ncbi:DUF3854 domain-containing protein [Thermosulfurimonas dismutans]|uniref:DUF3854 domain-containing protein n=1 Tax=Thermosulfurimonas dismutans TaxID=999894 RepID=A0A179D2S2_9BACT|nr:DUF3854 domain-containing protein [Thermosulfurimonas dismutans]OAQ20346.1 hypothetical protein TDIS_1541 [Thermosulfurimonas dismutans]
MPLDLPAWALEDLKKSGLTEATIHKAGIRAVRDAEDLKRLLGFERYNGNPILKATEAYLIPYPLATEPFGRIRLREPLNGAKYLSPASNHVRDTVHLYFPPNQPVEWLKSPKKPLVIVEGEKKALCLAQYAEELEFAVLGLGGVSMWAKAPEWKGVHLIGRRVFLAFDAPDRRENAMVRQEELALAGFLSLIGAHVLVLDWGEDPRKKGIDDLLVSVADPKQEICNLLEKASEVWAFYRELASPQELIHALVDLLRRISKRPERLKVILPAVAQGFNVPLPELKEAISKLWHAKTKEDRERQHKQKEIELLEQNLLIPTWPEPEPTCFYGLAGDFVKAVSDYTEASPVALLLTFLARWGCELGLRFYFPINKTRHFPRLFVLLCGPTGKGRKGTSLRLVREFFPLPDFSATEVSGFLLSGEAASDLFELQEETPPEGNRIFLIIEEFGSLLEISNRKGNFLSGVLRCLWDSEHFKTLGRKKKTEIHQAHLVTLGHTTISDLRDKVRSTDLCNGFLNRFIIALVRRSKLLPFPPPIPEEVETEIKEALLARFSELRNKAPQPFRFSRRAEDFWREVYPELSLERGGLAGEATNRAEAHVLRLSMCLATLDGSLVIDLQHVESALSIWRYCQKSVELIWRLPRKGEHVVSRILTFLKEKKMARLSEIHDMLGRHVKGEDLNKALQRLGELGLIREEKDKTGGRPARIIKYIGPDEGTYRGEI